MSARDGVLRASLTCSKLLHVPTSGLPFVNGRGRRVFELLVELVTNAVRIGSSAFDLGVDGTTDEKGESRYVQPN